MQKNNYRCIITVSVYDVSQTVSNIVDYFNLEIEISYLPRTLSLLYSKYECNKYLINCNINRAVDNTLF